MGSTSNWLDSQGLLCTLHSYGDVAMGDKPRPEIEYAYCHSIECAKNSLRVWKSRLNTFRRRCPDCGNQLDWKTRLKPYDEWKKKALECEHAWTTAAGNHECYKCKCDFNQWQRMKAV